MEHDLRYVMEQMRRPFSVAEAKCIFRQLLEGLAFLHDNWVLHRDMKTSNVLYSNRGEVKGVSHRVLSFSGCGGQKA